MTIRPRRDNSGDREVTVEMIGPRRPNPRLAPGEEAGALAAVSRACRLTVLLLGRLQPPSWSAIQEVGCALSSSRASSARVPPLVGVEVLAGDRRARRDDGMTRS